MTDAETKVWDILEGTHVCMLVDTFQEGLRARPMGLQLDGKREAIWFITDKESGKVDEVKADPEVCISVQDGTTWLSVTGEAELSGDREKMRALWDTSVDAWYPSGPEDPNIVLIKVTPTHAEYWDGPSKIVAGFKMLMASVTDETPEMGDNQKVSFAAS